MTQAQPQKGAWLIVTMMFFFMFINFADKAVLGLTAIPIMKELNLTPKEYGLIASSFFLLFAISSVSVGFLVNRISNALGAIGDGPHLGLVSIPNPRLGKLRHIDRVPSCARRGGRPGLCCGSACRL